MDRDFRHEVEDTRDDQDESPRAWRISNKPEMGVRFQLDAKRRRSFNYMNFNDSELDGARLILYFSQATITMTGVGLEELEDGIRRQCARFVWRQHVSEFNARNEARYVQNIEFGPPREMEE